MLIEMQLEMLKVGGQNSANVLKKALRTGDLRPNVGQQDPCRIAFLGQQHSLLYVRYHAPYGPILFLPAFSVFSSMDTIFSGL